ncbi:MAG: O-antigen ligase family protein [Acidobacteriota bacterium]
MTRSRSHSRKGASRRPAPSTAGSSPSASRWRGPEGWAELLLWGLLLTNWFLVFRSARDAFRLPKQVFGEPLVLLSIAALVLLLPAAWARAGGGGAALRRWFSRPTLMAVLPLLVLAWIGALASEHPLRVHQALPSLTLGALALVAWSEGLGQDRLRRLLRGLALPAAGLALIAFGQFSGIFRPFTFADGAEALRLGVTSLAGSAGDLGVFLVLPLLVALERVLSCEGNQRWLWLISAVLSFGGLLTTQTLTALLAAALGSAILLGSELRRRVATGQLSGSRVMAALALVATALGVLVVFAPPLQERVEGKAKQLLRGQWDEVLTGRLDGWKAALYMAEENPLTGVGLGAYAAEFAPAKLDLLDSGVSFYRFNPQVMFVNAHNEYLEVAAELGLPGALALLWGLICLLRRLRGAGWQDPRTLALARSGVAALGVLALAQFPFRLALTAWPALLFLAWIFAASETPAQEDGEAASTKIASAKTASAKTTSAKTTPVKTGPAFRALAFALSLLLAAGAVVHFQRGWERLTASRILLAAEVTSRAVVTSGQVPRGLLTRLRTELERGEDLDPLEFALPMVRGSLYLVQGQGRAAEAAYRRALSIEPRPELWLNLGKALQVSGDPEGARQAFDRAVRLDPRMEDQLPPPPP